MEPPPPPPPPPNPGGPSAGGRAGGGNDLLSTLLSGGGLSALKRRLHLDRMDAGELLLLLLVLYLLVEGEDLEPLLAVGLLLVFCLLEGGENTAGDGQSPPPGD